MFHFIHGYLPGTPYWDGLVQRGFIDNTSGVKITQHAPTTPDACFNKAAALGSPLFQIISESNRPFYVDRIQGGTYYAYYPFDIQLIKLYEDLLGKDFLGFQMHEWASNFKQDWVRIAATMKNDDWTAEELKQAIFRDFPFPYVYLESQSAEEFALTRHRRPKTANEIIVLLQDLFARRQEQVRGHLIPADSYYMTPRIEISAGAKNLIPEVGSQIKFTRIQIALTRGCAKAAGISWGTYYEPWGGDPFGACYYKRDMKNEWDISNSSDFPFEANGNNGGSSRALQKRILFYSYMSGAQYIGEEWGICNTFYDWQDFEITPYGAVKKDFLRFTSNHPDVGEVFVPFALVLPKELTFLDLTWIDGKTDSYLSFPIDEEKKPLAQILLAACNLIYGDGKSHYGNEAHAMTNSAFGDLFDLVYEDQTNLFSQYDYVVDLTGKSDFSNQYFRLSDRIIPGDNVQKLEEALNVLSEKVMPFHIDGNNIHWVLNRKKDGWIASFFNNDGIFQNCEQGEQHLSEADLSVMLTFHGDVEVTTLYGTEQLVRDGNHLSFTISAGELLILHIKA